MKQYYLGIDGGGTKTAVTIADLKHYSLKEFQVGTMNYNGCDRAVVEETIGRLFEQVELLGYPLDSIKAIGIGTAGVSNQEAVVRLKSKIVEQFQKKDTKILPKVSIVGDHEIALLGALDSTYEEAEGVIVMAGTGSIAYGRNQSGKEMRTGGFGYLIDDLGGGYAIGRDILSHIVCAIDGRGQPTILEDMVYRRANVTKDTLISWIYDERYKKARISSLAPLIGEAYEQGDDVARQIVEDAADGLVSLVVPIMERLELKKTTIVLGGSVLSNCTCIRQLVKSRLIERYPASVCILPKKSPAYGGTILAASNAKF